MKAIEQIKVCIFILSYMISNVALGCCAVQVKLEEQAKIKGELLGSFHRNRIDCTEHGRNNGYKNPMEIKKITLQGENAMKYQPINRPVSGWSDALAQIYSVAKSAATFHASLTFKDYWYGYTLTYNQIAGDEISDEEKVDRNGIYVVQDQNGAIVKLHDGKRTPLILGSILRSSEHIALLQKTFAKDAKYDSFGIFTLNRLFERNWAGLTEVLKKHANAKLFEYPTTDCCAPLLVDMIRAVYDLSTRDTYNHGFAYVHCRAGKGRSAVTLACYIAHLLHSAGIETSGENIELYLRSRRPVVGLNSAQFDVLKFFQAELKKAGSLEVLYNAHKLDITAREKELQE